MKVQFELINEASVVLGDPTLRRIYDVLGSEGIDDYRACAAMGEEGRMVQVGSRVFYGKAQLLIFLGSP
jgi:curved DNA-binding protein CbpA